MGLQPEDFRLNLFQVVSIKWIPYTTSRFVISPSATPGARDKTGALLDGASDANDTNRGTGSVRSWPGR